MKKLYLLLILTAIMLTGCQHNTVIAVVTDPVTAEKASDGVQDYISALQEEGYTVVYLSRDWKNPDSLKNELVELDSKGNLEGAVLIGDIPIPMIQGAQHMSSAFKIDPNRYKDQSRISIASDRFYDDPELVFNFMHQNEEDSLLFYYMLDSSSPQKVEKNFYSGRIYPPIHDETRFELINTYLKKAAAYKRNPSALDTMFTFTGHGYHSEALNAWENGSLMLREQFPNLYEPGGQVKNLNHTMSRNIKDIVMKELERDEVDMAIFHAHGGDDVQYIMGYPTPGNARENIEAVKRFVRSKLRSAKRRGNLEEAKDYYISNYDIPEHWVDDVFTEESILADSIADAKLDLWTEDVKTLDPGVEVVMFDECYNGQFYAENYISGTYIFGSGNTITGIANSVNVRQDIWANELLGLLRHGATLGEWHKTRNYMESHLIGDPTFHFKTANDLPLYKLSYNRLLRSDDATLRTYGVLGLYKDQGAKCEKELMEVIHSDPSANVRMEAYKCLAELRSDVFYDALKIGVNDPSELIRRVCVNWIGKTGQAEYIPFLVDAINNDASRRVSFSGRTSLDILVADSSSQIMDNIIDSYKDRDKDTYDRLLRRKAYSCKRVYDDIIPGLEDTSRVFKKRNGQLRSFRNYNYPSGIPILMKTAFTESNDVKLRASAVEVLGWYVMNPDHVDIAKKLEELLSDPKSSVAKEAEKSIKRLMDGPNVSVTP